jgi:hypothetical protein
MGSVDTIWRTCVGRANPTSGAPRMQSMDQPLTVSRSSSDSSSSISAPTEQRMRTQAQTSAKMPVEPAKVSRVRSVARS